MSSPDDRSLYKATPRWPAHLSVTVVVLNDRGDVAMHYWAKSAWGDDLYSLMHETLHNDESLEQAAARGLQEEWGVTGKITAYLGTHTANFKVRDRLLHKALPTFLARFVSVDASLRHTGPEGESKLVWLTFNKAADVMARQAERFPDRPDLDESVMLDWARQYVKRPS